MRTGFAKEHPDAVAAILRAHLTTVAWLNAHPEQGQAVVNTELKRLTGKALAGSVLKEAWSRLRFTDDPNRPNIMAFAEAASKAGYIKGSVDLAGTFDPSLLALARRQEGLGIELW